MTARRKVVMAFRTPSSNATGNAGAPTAEIANAFAVASARAALAAVGAVTETKDRDSYAHRNDDIALRCYPATD